MLAASGPALKSPAMMVGSGDRDRLPFPSGCGVRSPRRGGGDEQQVSAARQWNRCRQRAPGDVGHVSHSRIEHFEDPVRPPAGDGGPAVLVGERRRVGHDVGLVGSVQGCSLEKRLELAPLGGVGHLLQRHDIGFDGAQTLVQ
jgi:hypothetical protein